MDHDFKKVHFDMDYDLKKAYFDMDRDFKKKATLIWITIQE